MYREKSNLGRDNSKECFETAVDIVCTALASPSSYCTIKGDAPVATIPVPEPAVTPSK